MTQRIIDPEEQRFFDIEARLEKLERQFRILMEKLLGQREELPPEFREYVAGGKK